MFLLKLSKILYQCVLHLVEHIIMYDTFIINITHNMQQLLPCHIFYHGSSILHHVCAQMSWLKVWVPGEGDLRVEGAIPAGAWYVEFQGILGPGHTGWAWVRDRSTTELWFLRHQPMQDARYLKKDVWSQYTWDWES